MTKRISTSVRVFLAFSLASLLICSSVVFAQVPPDDPDIPWDPPAPTGVPGQAEMPYLSTVPGVAPGGATLLAWMADYLYNRKDSFKGSESMYIIVQSPFPNYLLCWYEYYPAGTVPRGHWMLWPWVGPYSGSIAFGPITAEPNEPYGLHVEKLWAFDLATGAIASTHARWTYEMPPPEAIATQTSVSVSSAEVSPEQEILVTAMVNPTPTGGTLTIQINRGAGAWAPIHSGSATTGSISTSWTATDPGTYLFQALYSGYTDTIANKKYTESQSPAQTVKAQLIKTSLSLMASHTSLDIDALTGSSKTVEISGTLSPAEAGAVITLTYSTPIGTSIKAVVTGPGGMFTDSFTPNKACTYQITATYQGDQTHEPSTSQAITVMVNQNWSTLVAIIGVVVVLAVIGLFFFRKLAPASGRRKVTSRRSALASKRK